MSNIEIDAEKVNNNRFFIDNDDINENTDPNFKTLKKLLSAQKLNPNNNDHLKYLLSLTLKEQQTNFNFQYLLEFLLKYKNDENINIFYDYLFHCCELGKLNYISLLLDNHLSINFQNEIGETPIHIAIKKKNIQLIKLLMEKSPNLSITTYKDKLSCYNYADISQDDEIKNIIYNKISYSKEINSKLKSFINGIETKNTLSSIESGTKNELLNYCGEIYKSSQKTLSSEMETIKEDEQVKMDEFIYNNNKNIKLPDNQELFEKNIYVKKTSNTSKGMNSINSKDFLLNKNENNFNLYSDKTVYKKKRITSNSDNIEYRFLTEKKNKKEYNPKDVDIKKYMLSASHPPPFSVENFEIEKNKNINNCKNNNYIKDNKQRGEENEKELIHFFTEINLPKEYAQKFIDNGFDDLNLLLFQTESGIAISNQNLKDIGISPYGERAKILIHLEERAGLIPYILEKEKIYSSEHYSNNKNNSLINFLDSINFRQYEKNFNDNGYYSSELLFTQMFTRQPIDENILKEDFNIGKKGHRLFLYNSLIKESKEYKKKLRKRGNTAMIYDEASLKACEPCIIY